MPSCKAISNVLASLAAINKVKHDEDQSKTGRIMSDIEWSIKAARLALKRRKNCQLTYNTYLQQIRNREGALEKLNKAAAVSPQPGEKGPADRDRADLVGFVAKSVDQGAGGPGRGDGEGSQGDGPVQAQRGQSSCGSCT